MKRRTERAVSVCLVLFVSFVFMILGAEDPLTAMNQAATTRHGNTRLQFTLRRLLKWIFVLSVLLAVGRWIYVRTILQARIARQLEGLRCEALYGFIGFRTDPFYGQWYRTTEIPPGCVITSVAIPVPMRSDDEARNLNRLFRQMPHLADAKASHCQFDYKGSDRAEQADRHFAIAIEGLRLRSVYWRQRLGRRSIEYIRDTHSVRAFGVLEENATPTVEELKVIGSAKHVTWFLSDGGRLSEGHMQVLGATKHLRDLRLYGEIPLDHIDELGALPHCELQLQPRNISDGDLRRVARLPNLTRLSLWMEDPSDDAVAALADAPQLRFLSLQDAFVSDAAVAALADSKSLQELNVCGTDISEEPLLRFRNCRPIKRICVSSSLDIGLLRHELRDIDIGAHGSSPYNAQRRAKVRAAAEDAKAKGGSLP